MKRLPLGLRLKGQGDLGKQMTEAGVAGESIHACAARTTARAKAPRQGGPEHRQQAGWGGGDG